MCVTIARAAAQMGFEGVSYTPPPLPTKASSKSTVNQAVKEAVQLDNPIDGLFALPVPDTLQKAAAAISDKGSISSSVKRGATLAKAKAGGPKKSLDAER